MSVVIIVFLVAMLVAIALWLRWRRPGDPVDSFRRQIDALGPDARRPVVDQVRRADDDSDQTGSDAS